MKSAAEILREAKCLIPDSAHWWRGPILDKKSTSEDGKCCPITAVGRARGDGDDVLELFAQANDMERRQIAPWNDSPERTLADIHQAFDRAIELAEAQ